MHNPSSTPIEVRLAGLDEHWQFPRRRPRPATVFTTRPPRSPDFAPNPNLAARGL